MIRLVGMLGAAAVAGLAFLGGHSVAGGDDGAPAAKARPRVHLAAAPAFVSAAGKSVALPVIAVRQLPALAPPHRKRGVSKPAPARTPVTRAPVVRTPVIRTPTVQTPVQRTTPKVTPKPPAKKPSGGGGGGGTGTFDDSG